MIREELKDYLVKASEKAALSRLEQRQQQQHVAVAMSKIKSSPEWKVYADHLEAMRLKHKESANAQLTMLNSNRYIASEKLQEIRMTLAIEQAYANALGTAIDLIDQLISRGKGESSDA